MILMFQAGLAPHPWRWPRLTKRYATALLGSLATMNGWNFLAMRYCVWPPRNFSDVNTGRCVSASNPPCGGSW